MKKSKVKKNKRGIIVLIIAAIMQFTSLAIQQYVIQIEGDIRQLQEYIPHLNNEYQNLEYNHFVNSSLYSNYLEVIEYATSNTNELDPYLLENFIQNTSYFMSLTLENQYVNKLIKDDVIDHYRKLKESILAIDISELDEAYSMFIDYLYEFLKFNREAMLTHGAIIGSIDEYNIEINNLNNSKQIYLLLSISFEVISFLLILIFFRLYINKNLNHKKSQTN